MNINALENFPLSPYALVADGDSPRGVTLHMIDYAPTYTKSVENGSFFLTYNVVNVFCKKGIFFTANRTLGVPKRVELFAV